MATPKRVRIGDRVEYDPAFLARLGKRALPKQAMADAKARQGTVTGADRGTIVVCWDGSREATRIGRPAMRRVVSD